MTAAVLGERAGGDSKTRRSASSRKTWLVGGLMVATLMALVLTFCLHATAHAQELHVHYPIPGDNQVRSAPPAPFCANSATIEDCFMSPSWSTYTLPTSNIQNPLSQGSALFFITPSDVTVGNTQIRTLWQWMVYVVDAFIVLILMLNGLKIMLGGTVFRNAEVLETLPGVLLGLIAAHLSLLIVALFLGLGNSLTADLYQVATANHITARPSGTTQGQIVDNLWCTTLANATGGGGTNDTVSLARVRVIAPYCLQSVDITNNVQTTPDTLQFPSVFDALGSLNGIAGLIIQVEGLMIVGVEVIILFGSNLCIVFAPAMIACTALPGKVGLPVTRLWFQSILSLALVKFGMGCALIITQSMIGLVIHYLSQIHGLDNSTIIEIVEIAVLWFVLRIPSLFNTSFMRIMADAGQAMGQAAGASIAVSIGEAQAGMQAVGGGVGLLAIAR
jgi:hypothetical protein